MLEILIAINTFSSSGTITLWLHHPQVGRSVMVCRPEIAKAGYPVLHSVLLEGIISGNRNSNTHSKKEAENAPRFPGLSIEKGGWY
jgi:hypothetical protein